jgi:hypothetical protein
LNDEQIRAQDGLLQRFLNRNSGKLAPTRQGEMLQYWFYGNNSDFILLLSLISHASLCTDILKESGSASDDDNDDPACLENAEEYLLPSSTFYDSFSKKARSIWNIVAAPFLKVSKEEIRDFIADDDFDEDSFCDGEVETDEPILSHRALHMQAELDDFRRERDADKRLAARYELAVKKSRHDDESIDQSDNYREDEDDEHSNEYDKKVIELESDSEDDEWQKSILVKRVAKAKSSTPRKLSSRRVSMSSMKVSPKKRPKAVQSDSESESPLLKSSYAVGRKRLSIQDSDDDE